MNNPPKSTKDRLLNFGRSGVSSTPEDACQQAKWTWKDLLFTRKKTTQDNQLIDDELINRMNSADNLQIREPSYQFNYCYIKKQDPCAPCCCKIDCKKEIVCLDTSLTPKTPSKCKCDRINKNMINKSNNCCNACGGSIK